MSKPLIITLSTILLLGLSAFGVNSHLSGIEKNETITIQKEEIITLSQDLISITDQNKLLRENIADLEHYVVELEGKIAKYEKEIITLKSKVASYEQKTKSKDNELSALRAKYFAMEQDLQVLLADKNSDQAKIADLTNLISQQRVKMDDIYSENTEDKNQLEVTKQNLVDAEIEKHRNERLKNIIEVTTINFNNIQIREFKDSRNLNRVGKKWNYTFVEFFMQNSDMMALLDEYFVLKIVNADTGEALAHIETNPQYPNSDNNSLGKVFQYSGDKVVQYFKNTDIKESENYEVQIFFLEGGKAYPLKNGVKQFIFNKKIVTQET